MRLRRSNYEKPGITRQRRGKGFSYTHPDGRRVEDAETLDRIRALAVPPAWTDVWISPWPNGHIQAVGTDKAGRRQYRYHDEWRVHRDREKFERVLDFAAVLPDVRARITVIWRRRDWDATACWRRSCGCSTWGSSASAARSTPGSTRRSA